ncbi:type 1 glutamine amidotransferase [Roseomonas sp. WA12]
MTLPHRFLVAESEAPDEREERRARTGRSSGESYAETLRQMVPDAQCELVRPAEENVPAHDHAALRCFDAVFVSGSPMHVYERTPEAERMLQFMRTVFSSGTPGFGSCAGLQVAVAACGGTVRSNEGGHEAGFARRIAPTQAGLTHPLLRGRPAAFDAPAIHGDEVDELPEGALLLAGNAVSAVQAAEIRREGGLFWGVQYHPELSLEEIGLALRRQTAKLIEHGLARDEAAVEAHAALFEELGREPERRDLAWALGVDTQVTDQALRRTELRNFLEGPVAAVRAARGRN